MLAIRRQWRRSYPVSCPLHRRDSGLRLSGISLEWWEAPLDRHTSVTRSLLFWCSRFVPSRGLPCKLLPSP